MHVRHCDAFDCHSCDPLFESCKATQCQLSNITKCTPSAGQHARVQCRLLRLHLRNKLWHIAIPAGPSQPGLQTTLPSACRGADTAAAELTAQTAATLQVGTRLTPSGAGPPMAGPGRAASGSLLFSPASPRPECRPLRADILLHALLSAVAAEIRHISITIAAAKYW